MKISAEPLATVFLSLILKIRGLCTSRKTRMTGWEPAQTPQALGKQRPHLFGQRGNGGQGQAAASVGRVARPDVYSQHGDAE